MSAPDKHLLHFVEKRLLHNRRVLAIMHFAFVAEVSVVKNVGEDKSDAVFVHAVAVPTAVVSLYVRNSAALEEPLYLRGINRIAREAVDLPTQYPLRLAAALFAALLECGLLSIFDALLATVLLVVFECAIHYELS